MLRETGPRSGHRISGGGRVGGEGWGRAANPEYFHGSCVWRMSVIDCDVSVAFQRTTHKCSANTLLCGITPRDNVESHINVLPAG